MHFKTLISAAVIMLMSHAGSVQAMPPQSGYDMPEHKSMHAAKKPHRNMPRPKYKRPTKPAFPSAEQLSRMLPPEPVTEEAIKKRFAEQRAHLTEELERDRKAAEEYAKDFARMQKYRAEQLAEMMARAEKRREAVVQRLNEREQAILERFRQRQQPEAEKPAEKPAGESS